MPAPTVSPGEFYQLDFEMSFVTQDDVFNAIEPVLSGVFEEFANGTLGHPGRRISAHPVQGSAAQIRQRQAGPPQPAADHATSSEHFKGSGFGLFAGLVEKGAVVRAVPAPGTAEKSRKFFDDMNEWARGEGFAGLGYATRKGGEWGGPIAKNHGEEGMNRIAEAMGLGPDDGIFFAAGKEDEAAKLAGAGPHARRRAARPDREGRVPLLLDRRLPDVRI